MSKERAQRRAEREREAAIRQAARAAEAERRERQEARKDAVLGVGRRLGLGRRRGTPGGTLARRRQRQHLVVVVICLVVVIVGFALRSDWAARLAVVVVAGLAYPVLRVLLFRRV